MDERWRRHVEGKLRASLQAARNAGEGRGGLGFLTATELARRVTLHRMRVLEVIEACPDTFRELDVVERRILRAVAHARLFALADWPGVT